MTTPRAALTRTGPIRSGLDYQDSYAIFRFVEWLEHPERFDWMQMECTDAGFLDDLVLASGDHRTLIQVKYSVHPESPATEWNAQTLIRKRKDTKKTFLQKWHQSWSRFRLSKKIATAFLVTNQGASRQFVHQLKTEQNYNALRIDPHKLKKSAPGLHDLAEKTVGSAQELREFCANFYFLFDQQELEVLKESARQRLNLLGVDAKGFRDLQEAVREWARKRDLPRKGGLILLDDIKSATGWNRPKALVQSFPIPKDFVLFDHSEHAHLIGELSSASGGVRVITGTPGTGKSTYLSYLYGQLTRKGLPCLRHHYFLSLDSPEAESYRRLTPDAARESLIHDLMRTFPTALGPNAVRNPHPRDLGRYIQTAADFFYRNGTALILIVDGLDHVVRERDARELEEFLADLLPISNGLWLVLGTRPLPDASLPKEIYDRLPQDQWIRLTGWDERGSRRLLWHHREELSIGDTRDHFGRIAGAFHEKSKGHPLYSRKLLEELRRRASIGFITDWDVEHLPQFPGDIETAYRDLWGGLSVEAQQVGVLLSVASMPLQSNYIVECLGGDTASNVVVQRGMADLVPFVEEHRDGVAFFHSSFREFIVKTEGFKDTQSLVLGRLKEWLAKKAPEDARWAHLARIEYFLGDAAPLLSSINREWIIRSICDARDPEQVLDQLSLSTHAAMELNDYALAHRIGVQA